MATPKPQTWDAVLAEHPAIAERIRHVKVGSAEAAGAPAIREIAQAQIHRRRESP